VSRKDRLQVCLFICSSTGNGESPENGLPFFRFLRREVAKPSVLQDGKKVRTLLSHMHYTMLGLGSSDYNKFQGAPRYLDEKLRQLGA
jgi:sulfite reductase (NADPH) flavoprotein alpha-component